MTDNIETILISACLMGLCTRYDAKRIHDESCIRETRKLTWIPVCPEQLGGLPTPREAADIIGGDGHDVLSGKAKVITKSGKDVSCQFILGAQQVLTIAQKQNITKALLKARSPSCAVNGLIGVTAALLQQNGISLEER